MFCRFCGATLPNDSTFCHSCGKSLVIAGTGASATTATSAPALVQAPVTPPKGRRNEIPILMGVLLIVFVLVVIWWAANRQDSSSTHPAFPQSTAQVPAPQLHTITVGSGALTVNASSYAYFTLTVPAGASTVRVQGHFSATGGSGNDIEVYLLSENQYTNWQNGHATPTFYNSGKVTVGDLNSILPNDVGTYYLVFNNRFSLLSPKAVEEHLTLTYYQ